MLVVSPYYFFPLSWSYSLSFRSLLASTVPSVSSFSFLLSHAVSIDGFVSLDSELGPGGRVSRTNRNVEFPLCETKNLTRAMWQSQRNPQGVWITSC